MSTDPVSKPEGAESGYTPVLKLADLLPKGKKVVKVNGKPVLLCNHQDRVYAVSNICSHQTMMMHPGKVSHGKITCPVHGSRFDLETGACLNLPATEPIATYPVRVVDGEIEVRV